MGQTQLVELIFVNYIQEFQLNKLVKKTELDLDKTRSIQSLPNHLVASLRMGMVNFILNLCTSDIIVNIFYIYV